MKTPEDAMRLVIERKKDGKVVLQVFAEPMSDGDLAVILEESAVDLRYEVTKDSETYFIQHN